MQMKKKIRFFLSIICTISILSSAILPGFAADTPTKDTVVVFTSDVHQTSSSNNASAQRLSQFLTYINGEYGPVDALGVCGDLGYQVKGDRYWARAQQVIDNVAALGIKGIYTTGNHEHENGYFSTTTNATKNYFTRLGVGKAADNYEIYCFGAASTTNEFPESDIEALSDYLKSVGTEKPVFILSHYALHALTYSEGGQTKIRDPKNREKVIDLLNQYPNTFFIWGHNHSKNDPNYDFVQTQCIGDKVIHFTYAAGGAMTESDDGNDYAGKITGKCLVALISPDGSLVSLRYLDINKASFEEWSNVTDVVQFTLNSKSNTLQLADSVSKKAAVSFFVACYDADGKMLGVSMSTQTLIDGTAATPLDYPSWLAPGDAASLQVMAVNPAEFSALCPVFSG